MDCQLITSLSLYQLTHPFISDHFRIINRFLTPQSRGAPHSFGAQNTQLILSIDDLSLPYQLNLINWLLTFMLNCPSLKMVPATLWFSNRAPKNISAALSLTLYWRVTVIRLVIRLLIRRTYRKLFYQRSNPSSSTAGSRRPGHCSEWLRMFRRSSAHSLPGAWTRTKTRAFQAPGCSESDKDTDKLLMTNNEPFHHWTAKPLWISRRTSWCAARWALADLCSFLQPKRSWWISLIRAYQW